MDLRTAWISYLVKDEVNGIPELSEVDGWEIRAELRSKFAKYKKLKKAIIKEAKKQGKWSGKTKDEETASGIVRRINLKGIIWMRTEKKGIRGMEQLRWITYGNEYIKKRQKEKRRREESGGIKGDDSIGEKSDSDREREESEREREEIGSEGE